MKFLQQPLKNQYISQRFGENKACYTIINGKPITISKSHEAQCPVGYQSVYSNMLGHNGLDILANHGQEVYNSVDGNVVEICTEEARGLGIGILTDKKYFCNETGKEEYFKVRYWHLMSIDVKIGDYVYNRQTIGKADNTGFSSGDHLHYEIKPVIFDESKTVIDDLDLKNVLQDNGYYGAIDPLPYIITVNDIEKDLNSQGFKTLWEKIVWVLKKYGSR